MADLCPQIDFRQDTIQSSTTREHVPERRLTAWQGDPNVGPFCYSGKTMTRQDWSPLVERVRNKLAQPNILDRYYDCCLINYYPGDHRSGMRYHQDPDQGVHWTYDTCVVSIGATRGFCFRDMEGTVHSFTVSHGDVTHMFRDCQEKFAHTVKKATHHQDAAPRISLVFKQSLGITATA